MKAGLNEEEEEEVEGVLKMEEWDNLRPRKGELNEVEEGSDEVFWKDGRWGMVEKELVGRVREELAMEEQSGNMFVVVFWVGEISDRKR
jgi:hypothetical protein